jgi:2-polyprenyl-3-methyl-5-hydroxy-6-metoxy-1,4-benzoquinol methylase
MFDSDKHWRRLGTIDPYLRTVRTLDPYKLDSASPDEPERYFASGERYITHLFDTIERHVAPGFRPRTGVDFGCSVGRLSIPLARRCQSIVGLDVSRDALAEGEANAARQGVTNARWLASDDELSNVTHPVDLFHSYNVLQHLPVERGMSIIRRALHLLDRGGIIAVHVPYADRASRLRRAINWAQVEIPGVNVLANIARGRPYDYPQMLMNSYDVGAIMDLTRERGCSQIHCLLIDQGRYPGAVVIARAAS